MSLLPVMVVFGLSFPPVLFTLLAALLLFFVLRWLLRKTRIYEFVWHPTLFNTALYCCLFYLVSYLFV